MFGIFFKSLSSICSFLFPIVASYRALEANDILVIRPWLMYWVVLALVLTVETYAGFLLSALPLYQFFRSIFLLWLVLPQTQGASQLYLLKIEPFLREHDQQIDKTIATWQRNFQAMLPGFVSWAIAYIQKAINSASGAPTQPNAPLVSAATPGQPNLFSRIQPFLSGESSFSAGSFRLAGSSLVSSYLSGFSGSGSSKGITIPSSLPTKADKLDFLEKRRKELSGLLESISHQMKTVEQESDDSSKDEGFDFVKKEDFKVDDRQSSPSTSPEEVDVDKGTSSGVEPAASKSWFRFN